ncbi:phosphonate ABC transporter, permease protein PhnE [Seohaeicola zhoushanensis]|uniref:Phosphonate ABC transporter, permease protein PhnE n=1 Tax=Seohaeicola zhoushanensis TaxID=1569283 RepID=A0A8J3GXP1_9RHOB|nr:phosphonate ABC transporter, permease protein PhnE [Seohaeicola zhoushanensis]GHF48258.1 phosphonate ABC transporter, permease protein PhnE [Seohaeicola zhoushanensis]
MTDQTAPGLDRSQAYLALVRQRRLYGSVLTVLFVVALVAGFRVADDRNAGGFWEGLPQILDFPADVIAEAWRRAGELPGLLWHFLPSLIETLNIAAVSTLTGAFIAFFLALLSTRGLARWPRLVPLFRRLMDVLRAIPDIVIALVLIFLMGGGPVPAMIAIAIHTAGALGKQFSEVNENADLKPVEGLASTGAVWGQQMWLGVVPQVAPNYLSYALLRFEINIRASAILGFVGAGGLGYDLRNAISWGMGQFAESAAIFILLFGTIVLFDQLSSQWRDRLIRERSRA